MNKEDFAKLKQNYLNIEIPTAELDAVVKNAMNGQRSLKIKRKSFYPHYFSATAAVLLVFIVTINTVPSFAATLKNIPVIGSIVTVLTLKTYTIENKEKNYDLNIDVPQVSGLTNKELQASLNKDYLESSKSLYEQFSKKIGEIKDGQLANHSLDSGYKIKVNHGDLLVIAHYVTESRASSTDKLTYETVDTKNGLLITLSSLFKDERYVEVISQNIISQMKEQVALDDGKVYDLDPTTNDYFKTILKDQNFYINENNKLVISFDKYEVAPGYMGTPEFEIPTDVIADLLVGNEYVK